MNEIKVYFEIKDLAVAKNGERCPAGMQLSLGKIEKQVDYAELTKNVNIPGILKMAALDELGVKPEDVKIITPEEYNGHNFWGNKNYYAVDSRIYESIKSLVPDDIGIIVYYEKTDTMRIKKECAYKEISYETKTQLLYDALKKWVDGAAKKLAASADLQDAIF